MAEILGMKGSSRHCVVGRRVDLVNAESPVFDVLTITENSTIGEKTPYLLAITASGANRNLSFLSAVEVNGGFQVVYNAGSTYSIVVKNSAAATLLTLAPGELAALVYDSTAWAVLWKVTASSVPTIAPTTISLTDNSATALVVSEGANAYLTFDTANSSESVRIHKVLELLGSGLDMSQGAAGQSLYLKDNEAAALDVTEAANSYLKFVTTNSGEKVQVGKTLDIDAASVDLSTQASVISIKDNEAAALDISEGANVYLRCVTTNSGEQVVVGKPVHHAGGIAAASVFTSTEQTGTGGAQNIAHGLGSTPSLVWFAVSEDPAGTGFDVAPGAHDATNCVFTVTTGVKYYVYALK